MRVNDRGPFVKGRSSTFRRLPQGYSGMIQSGNSPRVLRGNSRRRGPGVEGRERGRVHTALRSGAANPVVSPTPAGSEPTCASRWHRTRRSRTRVSTVERLGLSGIKARIESSGVYHRVVIDASAWRHRASLRGDWTTWATAATVAYHYKAIITDSLLFPSASPIQEMYEARGGNPLKQIEL